MTAKLMDRRRKKSIEEIGETEACHYAVFCFMLMPLRHLRVEDEKQNCGEYL